MKNLNEIEQGKCKTIQGFTHKIIARKLITMGVLPGKEIEIIRAVPFNSTMYVRVQDCHFAIRKTEAAHILIS